MRTGNPFRRSIRKQGRSSLRLRGSGLRKKLSWWRRTVERMRLTVKQLGLKILETMGLLEESQLAGRKRRSLEVQGSRNCS